MNKEIIGDDYPTYEDSVNMTLREKGHYVCNIPATDFTDDEEKMADFNKLTKQEFLDSYSLSNRTGVRINNESSKITTRRKRCF